MWADLRFGEQTVTTDNWRIEVRLAQAEISAEFRGCSVEQGTRLGDAAKKQFEVVTEHEKGEVNLSQSAQGSAKIGTGFTDGFSSNVSVQAAGKAERVSSKATERKVETQHDRIKALPNNRWRISEPTGTLDGTYLRAPRKDESGVSPLCELSVSTNRFSVALAVRVRPNDLLLNIQPVGTKSWWIAPTEKPNKEAVAKLLIQAAATSQFGSSGDERVTLASISMEGRRKKRSGG